MRNESSQMLDHPACGVDDKNDDGGYRENKSHDAHCQLGNASQSGTIGSGKPVPGTTHRLRV
jgi:hypothetical protein